VRTFRLGDADFAALAAGRPARHVLAELRKAEISRHLLRQTQLPSPYGVPPAHSDPADPLAALHTAATLAALRAGAPPPPRATPSARTLHADHHGLKITLRLEDRDPVRARLGLKPAPPLTAASAARWQILFDEAWRLLVDRHRPMAETMAEVLSVIVPVESDAGSGGISATSAEAYGAVAMSAPADATALAVGLLHETQHSVLNATLFLFDLVRPTRALTYSPWRADPRPPSGVLHGAYAYQAVTRFWRTEPGRLAAFEFVRWRGAVVAAADGLLDGEQLTAAGRRFVGALREEVAGWRDQPGGERIARLARGANADHRVRWRLRNLRVRPETVAVLAEAWRRGEAPPPVPEAEIRAAPRRILEVSDRLRLVHSLLRDQSPSPAGRVRPFADAQAGAGHGTPSGPYGKGNLAWLRGDMAAAFAEFLLAAERDDEFWAGLSLTAPGGPLQRPELARAVWQATSAKDQPTQARDVAALVAWIAQVAPPPADGSRGGAG
jgi:hypothetical protein